MPDVTPKPLRSQANGIINLMGALGAVFSLLLISKLVPATAQPNYMPPLFAIVAGLWFLPSWFYSLPSKRRNWRQRWLFITGKRKKKQVTRARGGRMEPAVYRSFLFILASIFFLVLFL